MPAGLARIRGFVGKVTDDELRRIIDRSLEDGNLGEYAREEVLKLRPADVEKVLEQPAVESVVQDVLVHDAEAPHPEV